MIGAWIKLVIAPRAIGHAGIGIGIAQLDHKFPLMARLLGGANLSVWLVIRAWTVYNGRYPPGHPSIASTHGPGWRSGKTVRGGQLNQADNKRSGVMTGQLRALTGILLSILLFVMGAGLMTTLIPVRGHLAGFGDVAIGVIGSAYYAGFVLGCFGGPPLLTRIGHIRSFAIAGGAAAATILLQSIDVGQLVWIFARFVFGLSSAGIYMVTESWLNDRASNDTRGRILAIYLTVNYGGIVIGQWFYTVAPPLSFVLFNIAAIFCVLCVVPVGATRLAQPVPSGVPAIRPWRLFRIAPVGVAGCIAVGAANGAVWTLAPVYANVHGLHGVMLAAFMSAFTAAGALSQAPVGRLSDHMDRRWTILVMSLLAGLSAAALAFWGGGAPLVAIALFALFGAAALPIYGLSVAHTNDRIPREDFVSASATLLLVNALASVVGPVVAAEITTHTSLAALFWFVAAIHGLHVAFVIWRVQRAERPPEVFRERYAPVLPQATPTALELDPRGPQGPA